MPKQKNSRVLHRKEKNAFRKKTLFFLAFFSILLLSLLTYGTYLYVKADAVFSNAYEDDNREKSDLRSVAINPAKDNTSILIMGVDTNTPDAVEGVSRTDSLMVATFNKEQKDIKLLSIPRDSYVYIPEVDYKTKINHAHAYGGTDATIDTIENLLDIPIDYYVKMNFHAFIEVIDAIDGITIDIPYEFQEQNSQYIQDTIHLYPGEQKLDGEEALALARTRKLDNDIERGKRQQEIIKAVIKKSASLGSILKYSDIIEAVGNNMTTNMKFSEMKSFISYGLAGNDLDIKNLTLEGNDYQPGEIYYWKLNEDALQETKQILKQHLELDTDE